MKSYIICLLLIFVSIFGCKPPDPPSSTPTDSKLSISLAPGQDFTCFPPAKFFCDIEVWGYDQQAGDFKKNNQYSQLNLNENHFSILPGSNTITLKNFLLKCVLSPMFVQSAVVVNVVREEE